MFSVIRGVVVPPENNPIMSGTSIRSFKHLEHQNLSIISEDIDRNRMLQKKVRRRVRSKSRSRKSYSYRRGYLPLRSDNMIEDLLFMYAHVPEWVLIQCRVLGLRD